MKKSNLPPFYVGQKVVYITGNYMKKNTIHTVTDIWMWGCGCWVIEINNNPLSYIPPQSGYIYYICATCSELYPIEGSPKRRGWAATSFRPTEELKAPIMTFEKIKEKEREEVLINN